jgi:hypothetical protein
MSNASGSAAKGKRKKKGLVTLAVQVAEVAALFLLSVFSLPPVLVVP